MPQSRSFPRIGRCAAFALLVAGTAIPLPVPAQDLPGIVNQFLGQGNDDRRDDRRWRDDGERRRWEAEREARERDRHRDEERRHRAEERRHREEDARRREEDARRRRPEAPRRDDPGGNFVRPNR
ncbi:MAG TPA: hypothetical protein VGM87_11740 [Roseomonas sp.]